MNRSTATTDEPWPWRAARFRTSRNTTRRQAKILVLFALILPVLIGIVGVVVDGGLLTVNHCHVQNVADAAATVAAMEVFQGATANRAKQLAQGYVQYYNGLSNADVDVFYPPRHVDYAADDRYVEVSVTHETKTYFIHVLGGPSIRTVSATSVAGFEPSTDPAAITILSRTTNGRAAGLDVDANGTVKIDGAVLVNNESGAFDEDGTPAGRNAGPPFAIRTARGSTVKASHVRVAGGVEDPAAFRQANLRANQLPVEDPLQQLRPPTVRSRGKGRGQHSFGGVEIPNRQSGRSGKSITSGKASRPQTLEPGLYDFIQVTSGRVTFRPGIYFIRSVHPRSRIALNLQGGQITAKGVLFYIDASANVTIARNSDSDFYMSSFDSYVTVGETASTVIRVGPQSEFSPLEDPGGDYDGMLLFQKQNDLRSINIDHRSRLRNRFAGIVYAKSGHVDLTARGTCQASFVAGTMSIKAPYGCRITPLHPQPPAEDIYLVE